MLEVKHVQCAGVWLLDWENGWATDMLQQTMVRCIYKSLCLCYYKVADGDHKAECKYCNKWNGERRRITDRLHHAQFQLIINVQCCICTTRTSFQGSIRISRLLPIWTFNTTTFLNWFFIELQQIIFILYIAGQFAAWFTPGQVPIIFTCYLQLSHPCDWECSLLLAPQLKKSSAMQNRLPPIHGGCWSKMVWRVICCAPFAQAHDLFFSLPSGTLQVSTIQRSTFQLCVPQVDIPEVSTLKISSTKVSSTEFCAFQVSLL